MNGDAVPNIINLLNEQICPEMPGDIEGCKDFVATYWPKISEKIFDPVAAQYICGPDFIGDCPQPPTKHTRKDWTCEDCHNGVTGFGSFYADDRVIKAITEGLQGDDFCTNPDNGFPDDAIEECAQGMGVFMPPSL